ncbi:MAG: cupin domain-containing protein [Nitrosopumilaceae archaeon]|nr:cupin domain-containing protein [Nitrosopumilaceae archaeon]
MSAIKKSDISEIIAREGTKVYQYFHPHNTLEGIDYSIARFTLESGKKSKLHKLQSSEVYYILEGTAKLHIEDEVFVLEKDDSCYVPPMNKQFIENTGNTDLRFLCIVQPAWRQDDETILE